MSGALWLGLVLTVLATTGNNLGKVLQKLGTEGLPPPALRWSVLTQYLRRRLYVAGLASDIGGALLTVAALALAPVSLMQPVLTAGASILLVFSHVVLGERMVRSEQAGVLLSLAGAIGLGATARPGGGHVDAWGALVVLAAATICVVALERRSQRTRQSDLAAGIQAGVCFGLSAATLRAGLSAGHALPIGLGFLASCALTGTGFFLQTRGLQRGRAAVVGSWAGVSALAWAALAGRVALGEPWPASALGFAVHLVGLASIAAGVLLSSWPRPSGPLIADPEQGDARR